MDASEKVSKLEKSILTQLHLQGYWGKSGNLTKKQRLDRLKDLTKRGYLDSTYNPTSKAIKLIAPKF